MSGAEYNLTLVALSFFVAVIGSYTALNLAARIPSADTGSGLFAWLSMAAVALGGGGIWSMHFIGMLAYEMDMPVSYAPGLTIGSLLLAVVVCGIGLFIVGRGALSVSKLLLAGVITGLGVAGMHYTGMAAMDMPATITYHMPIFYLSIAIAIFAATAAFWLAFNQGGGAQRFISAVVMGIAVCGMHYTGMAAMILTPDEAMSVVENASTVNYFIVSLFVFLISATIMAILLLVSTLQPGSIE